MANVSVFDLVCLGTVLLFVAGVKGDTSCGVPVREPVLYPPQLLRIRGGQEAIPGSWPWQVGVGVRSLFGSGIICGGSIIDERHILTAAHCFIGASPFRKYFVRVGDHNTQVTEVRQKDYEVQKVTSHPLFTSTLAFLHDIAVLKLAKPIIFSATVSPVCLPEQGSDAVEDRICVVTGWGSTVNQTNEQTPSQPIVKPSPVLKQAILPILNRSLCREVWGPQLPISEDMICTAAELLDREPCQGDSGGPLSCQSAGNAGRYVQEGIISFGAGCGQMGPAVFTRVGQFRNWIKSITNAVTTITLR